MQKIMFYYWQTLKIPKVPSYGADGKDAEIQPFMHVWQQGE